MRRFRGVGILFMVALAAAPAWAEGEPVTPAASADQEQQLEPVVVTATRNLQPVSTAPGDVAVVNRETIDERPALMINDALKAVPGFFSRSELDFSPLQPVIVMHGIAGQNRTLVMVDGITLNEPRTGAGYFDGLALGNVDRIEVVKGPFSSLYGGYAMAGVINVLTKMPEKREVVIQGGYGGPFSSGEAPKNVGTVYASYGDRFLDRWSVFLSYGRTGTDGFPSQWNVTTNQPGAGVTGAIATTTNAGRPANWIGNAGDAGSFADNITLKTQYAFSDTTTLGFTYLRTNTQTTFGTPQTFLQNAAGTHVFNTGSIREASFLATRSGRTRDIFDVTYTTTLGPIQSKLSTGLVDVVQSYNRTPGSTALTTQGGGPGTYLDSPAMNWFVDLQFTAPEVARQVFTWGFTFQNQSTTSTTYALSNWQDPDSKTQLTDQAGGTSNTYGLYVQDEVRILKGLTAYLGIRGDWWKTFDGYNLSGNYAARTDGAVSPKGSLVYQPFAATTLRLDGGQSFRPPSLYELYSKYVGSYTLLPNPTLDAETDWSWDGGVTQGLWPGAQASVTYFQNFLSNLIYTQTLTPTLQTRVNVGKAESKGVEMVVEQRLFGVRLFGDATYTDAHITQNTANPAIVGKQMIDVPTWLCNMGVEGAVGPVSGSLVGRYVSKRYSTDLNTDTVNHVYTSYDPFLTLDGKLAYTFLDHATLAFQMTNITNKQYFTYYQSPGRAWLTQLTMKF